MSEIVEYTGGDIGDVQKYEKNWEWMRLPKADEAHSVLFQPFLGDMNREVILAQKIKDNPGNPCNNAQYSHWVHWVNAARLIVECVNKRYKNKETGKIFPAREGPCNLIKLDSTTSLHDSSRATQNMIMRGWGWSLDAPDNPEFRGMLEEDEEIKKLVDLGVGIKVGRPCIVEASPAVFLEFKNCRDQIGSDGPESYIWEIKRGEKTGDKKPSLEPRHMDSKFVSKTTLSNGQVIPLAPSIIKVVRAMLNEDANYTFYTALEKLVSVQDVIGTLQQRNLLVCSQTGVPIGKNDNPAIWDDKLGCLHPNAARATAPVMAPPAVSPDDVVGKLNVDDLAGDIFDGLG